MLFQYVSGPFDSRILTGWWRVAKKTMKNHEDEDVSPQTSGSIELQSRRHRSWLTSPFIDDRVWEWSVDSMVVEGGSESLKEGSWGVSEVSFSMLSYRDRLYLTLHLRIEILQLTLSIQSSTRSWKRRTAVDPVVKKKKDIRPGYGDRKATNKQTSFWNSPNFLWERKGDHLATRFRRLVGVSVPVSIALKARSWMSESVRSILPTDVHSSDRNVSIIETTIRREVWICASIKIFFLR